MLAVGGLVLWQAGLGPGVAVVAAIPTYRHAWRRPHEESWIFYACSGAATTVGLWSLDAWTVATVAFSLYLVLLCGSLVAVVLIRRAVALGPRE